MTKPTQAYILPSFYMLKMLARQHGGINKGTLIHRVSFYKKTGELQESFLETLTIDKGDHISTYLEDSDGTVLAHMKRSLNNDTELPLLYDLIFVHNHEDLFEHIKATGIPLKTERELYMDKEGSLPYKPESKMIYSRFENHVAIVLGADTPNNTTDPQLWIEKGSFFPLRLFLPSISGGPIEYRLSGNQADRTFWYPHFIQVFVKNHLWAKIETMNVKLDKVEAPHASKITHEPNSDTKALFEQYFQWVR